MTLLMLNDVCVAGLSLRGMLCWILQVLIALVAMSGMLLSWLACYMLFELPWLSCLAACICECHVALWIAMLWKYGHVTWFPIVCHYIIAWQFAMDCFVAMEMSNGMHSLCLNVISVCYEYAYGNWFA